MNRRELIKLVSLSTGTALGAPLFSSLLTSCNEVEKIADKDYVCQLFDEDEFSTLKAIVDTILPKTDSPSATEVGVHKIIDTMVGTVYNTVDKENYYKKFKALKEHLSGSSENMLEKLQKLSKAKPARDSAAKKSLLDIKQQTIAYYLSTGEVAKEHLTYLPVPGKYESCISLEEAGGKLWAL